MHQPSFEDKMWVLRRVAGFLKAGGTKEALTKEHLGMDYVPEHYQREAEELLTTIYAHRQLVSVLEDAVNATDQDYHATECECGLCDAAYVLNTIKERHDG